MQGDICLLQCCYCFSVPSEELWFSECERGETLFTDVYVPVFASLHCVLPSSCHFRWKCFSPLAVAACFRPQSFVISGALFMHLPERNVLLSICAPVWRVCVERSSGGFAHTKTHFQLKAPMTDLRTAALKLNWQKQFLNLGQIARFHALIYYWGQ